MHLEGHQSLQDLPWLRPAPRKRLVLPLADGWTIDFHNTFLAGKFATNFSKVEQTLDSPVDQISADLKTLGLRPGGILLVHSSLKSLGRVPGGPETVIRGLLDALQADGTLLMPALSYRSVTPSFPFFDFATTPACVGMIPEYFRTRPGSLRSCHPTHSVCGLGPHAQNILEGHVLDDTPCGTNSPFRRLRDHGGGQLLFLGCGLKPNTSMHAVEELVEPAYLFRKERATIQIIDSDGTAHARSYRQHGFEGVQQRYERVEELLDQGSLRTGLVLEAPCHLLEFDAMWNAALDALKRNPVYFVDATCEYPNYD